LPPVDKDSPDLRVVPVEGGSDFLRFLEMPATVYADDPNWVHPLLLERRQHLDAKRNPFLTGIDIAYWTAWRGRRPVGRISAQVNAKHLERHDDATGHFGFLEAEDDPEVWAALTRTAEAWLRRRGMRRIAGPFNPSINDECGVLVDGFATPPMVMMGHGRSWYGARLEALGYGKLKDLYAYCIAVESPWPRLLREAADRAAESEGLRVRAFDMRRYEEEIRGICDIFNDAWSDNWGFIPFGEEEAIYLARSVRPLITAESFAVAELRGEPAAMIMILPNLNEAIRDLGGRLLPLGWAKLLWRLKVEGLATARVPLMGVRKRYQRGPLSGALAFALVADMAKRYQGKGMKWMELSWILEDNTPMNKLIRLLGGERYKTYRIYGKELQ
jgi:hypothetical protein